MMWQRTIAMIIALTSCQAQGGAVTDTGAMDIAGLYVEKNCSGMRTVATRPVAELKGRNWLVSHERPNGSKSGLAEVEIDADTGRIIKASGGGCPPMKASRASGGISGNEAIRVARKYVAEHYSPSLRLIGHPAAHDQGENWIVTYDLPKDSIGGTPTIEVDKRTGLVSYARHTQ